MSSRSSSPGEFEQDSVLADRPDDVATSLRATREQDRRKGLAISHQLAIWNAILDARIQLQKALAATNSLPSSTDWPDPEQLPHDAIRSVVEEAAELSRELLNLQANLYKGDAVDVPVPQPPAGSEDPADTLSSWSSTVSDTTSAADPHLLRTLTKWSAKIQVAAPNFASGGKSSGFKASLGQAPGIVQAIQDTLDGDRDQLLSRTRSLDQEQGAGSEDIFVDTDFYQQLLRDVIESKSTSGSGDDVAWMRRQAQAKRSKTVDTKASKGRKLRYEVHEKLQHFMIPIPVTVGAWPDEQVDELFSSL
ncbi:rRNA-processing protein bfr2, partial [Steccherinum ochraceum]